MRFIQGMQAEAQRPRPEVEPHLTELPSILDLPNRKFLAQQGYYGREFIATTTAASGSQSPHIDAVAADVKTLSATEIRKKFHQAVKTARSTNWSFTDEDEDEDNVVSSSSLDTANTSSGSDSSFDQGLRTLRSFSTGICSESSEDNDSFEAERHLVHQISMRALRQQYQDTIQQSMDENIPVFNDLNNISVEESLDSDRDPTPRITDRRKEQVNRLMSSLDDDGDYLTISIPANQKGMLTPLLRLAQHSTHSTLTGGSPDTPNEPLSDKCFTDGGHFKFPEQTHPKSPSIKPVVSITFDQSDCGNSNSNSETREFTPSESRQLADSLQPLLSTQRSDLCHTLVSQDSSTDHDVSGSVTPRPGPGDLSPGIILQDQPNFIDNKYIYGDALSESTSSSGTLNTVVVVEDLPDLVERRLRSPLLRSGSAVDLDGKQTTLAAVYPPQESFELEEISSADNTFDDFTTCNRNLVKRGPIEKSASIHSDSSGFVDLDTPGEPQTFTTSGEPQQLEKSPQFTPFGEPQHFVDTQQHDCMCANKKFPVRKSKTFDAQYDYTSTTMTINHHHDNQLSQSLLQLPVSSSDRPTKTVQRAVSENLYPTNSDSKYKLECRHDSLKHIHVCNKTDSLDDKDVENQNPTLTSISVVKNVKGHSEGDIDNNKSVMFTIRVPSLEEKSGTDAGQDGRSETKRRYVSTMAINVSANDKSQKPIHHTKQTSAEEKTRVNFSLEHDLSPVSRSDTVVSVSNLKQTLSADNVCSGSEKPLLPSNQVESSVHLSNGDVDEQTIDTRCKPGITDDSSSYKKHILHKRRSKESLIASHNQTADWLLSNQRDEALRSKQGDRLGFCQNLNKGKQMSSSTPNLLDRETQTFGANCDLRKDILTVYFPSTNTPKPNPIERNKEIENDKTLTEIKKTADNVQDLLQNLSSAESVVIKHYDSLDLSESGVCGLESLTSPVVTSENIQHDLTAPLTLKPHVNLTSNTADLSESGVSTLQSQISSVVKSENVQHDAAAPLMLRPRLNSSTGNAVDVLGYCKLARLTNAPTISMLAAGQQRFPLMKYQPYQSLAQVRKWHDLNKLKHLEAETSLMQHALQRYKVELTVMETMLLTAIAAAGADLDLEDRAELNDLRSLWSEVKREVGNMEVHLSTRLTSLRAGNDQFSPFNAMSIVQSMIDLLREQLYQQQMCLYKDVNGNDDGILVPAINPAHPSAQSAIAHKVAPNITDDVARSQVQQKEEMERSFTDLKDTLVREVKDELQGNTKWLQLQLQSKDNEIQRLKMELFMQRVNTGETRKRETFESDV